MSERLLSVEGVTKKFGGLVAVNNATLYVAKNEIVGLIGSNGAGKTTLFNVIAGDLKPTSGKVVYQGSEIQSLPPHRICRSGNHPDLPNRETVHRIDCIGKCHGGSISAFVQNLRSQGPGVGGAESCRASRKAKYRGQRPESASVETA